MNNKCQKSQVVFKGNNKALRKYERTSHKENPKWKSTETIPRRIALFLAFLWPILSIFITYQIADPSKGWYDYVSWYMCICFPFEIVFASAAIIFYKNDRNAYMAPCAGMSNTAIIFENNKLVFRYVEQDWQSQVSLVDFVLTQDVNMSRRTTINTKYTEYEIPYAGIEAIEKDKNHPSELVLTARCVKYIHDKYRNAPAARTAYGCFENHQGKPAIVHIPLLFEGGESAEESFLTLLKEKVKEAESNIV